jgi:hypothetical protein
MSSSVTSSGSGGGGGPAILEFAVAPESFAVDMVSPVDNGLVPDGELDGVFSAKVLGPVRALVLVSVGIDGVCDGGHQVDTVVGSSLMPKGIDCGYWVGAQTWVLGVTEGTGPLLNLTNGSIPILDGTIHSLKLHSSNQTGLLGTGLFYWKLHVESTDGSVIESAWIPY